MFKSTIVYVYHVVDPWEEDAHYYKTKKRSANHGEYVSGHLYYRASKKLNQEGEQNHGNPKG